MWLEGYQALLRWRAENSITSVHAVPYDTEVEVGVTKDFPLGRWVHQQRKALRAGELEERRKTLLDAPEAGMLWEPGEEAWENKLAALRSYRRAVGHLAPRQDAVWDDPTGTGPVPIGQYMANLRRKGARNGLGKDPDRAATRAAQLAAIDKDWDCPWPLDWQRHYRILADLVDADGHLPYIAPGITFEGDDIGTWRWRQQEPGTWAQLMSEQRERLTALGVRDATLPVTAATPAALRPGLAAALKGPKKPGSKAEAAFQRGLTALEQWVEREGTGRPVPRGAVVDVVVDDETVPVRLGVWLSNAKARRDKLTVEQLAALAALGMVWAAASATEAAPEPAPPAVLEHHNE
ncbi:helicase [Streptomyces sp. SID2563]|nr:helicase [Streptomyces sp. SID2563]